MIVYGKNVVREVVYAKKQMYRVLIDEKFNDKQFIDFLNNNKVKYTFTNKGELNNLTDNNNHQGVVAEINAYQYKNLEDILDVSKIQRFIILDEITDPHNLGAIIRSADAVKLDGIIVGDKNQVPLTATVAKVSSGAIEHVNLIKVNNINQAIIKLKKNNVLVVGTDGNTSKSFLEIPTDISTAIVLGSEGDGIRPLIKRNCDMLVKIPMYGKINSLNVSVAAALMMYAGILKK